MYTAILGVCFKIFVLLLSFCESAEFQPLDHQGRSPKIFALKWEQRLGEVGTLAQSPTHSDLVLKMEFKSKYAWLQSRASNPTSMYTVHAHSIVLPFPSYMSNYPFELVCLDIHLRWGLHLYLYLQQLARNRCIALSSCSINIYETDIIKAFHAPPPLLQAELLAPSTHTWSSHRLTSIAWW